MNSIPQQTQVVGLEYGDMRIQCLRRRWPLVLQSRAIKYPIKYSSVPVGELFFHSFRCLVFRAFALIIFDTGPFAIFNSRTFFY